MVKRSFISLGKYSNSPKTNISTSEDKIAVIYCDGEIVSGESGDDNMGSETIAKAIKKEMKSKIQDVSVLPSHVTLRIDNKMFIAEMPKYGSDFIKRFDHGQAVNNFKLNLNFKKGYALV
jgi:hypothetical protein